MLKKAGLFILALMLILVLTACSSDSAKTPEVTDITADMLKNLELEDEMLEIKDSILSGQYDISLDKLTSYSVYVSGSGAKADEICVMRAKSKDDAKAIKTALEQRISSQTIRYEDYIPDELPKLEDALIAEKGEYLMLAIVKDTGKAQEIFDSYFK